MEKVKAIAIQVNERKRQVENMSTILELQQKINKLPSNDSIYGSLLQPSRRFIKKGQINYKSSGKDELCWIILFSDCLLRVNNEFVYKDWIELAEMEVGKNEVFNNTIDIYSAAGKGASSGKAKLKSSQASLILEALSKEDFEGWLHLIQDCKQKMTEFRHGRSASIAKLSQDFSTSATSLK